MLSAPEGAILAGASAAVLAVVAATTVWGGSIRVAIPWAGRPHLALVSTVIVGVALASAAASGAGGALYAHLGGLAAGVAAAGLFMRRGRKAVGSWLSRHRLSGEIRRRALDKADVSGYESLTDSEKKLL